jgi:hypothetical protein
MPFWRTVMAYRQGDEARLTDPLRRDPTILFHQDDDSRPLRNRLHVDVGRPPEAVASAVAELRQTPSGPYGLMVSDEDGNEVDLVPGGPMSDAAETADWRAPFAAMVFYPTAAPEQASALVTAVAGLADDAGIPLLIDVRPDGVTIDSGKDLWEGADGPSPPSSTWRPRSRPRPGAWAYPQIRPGPASSNCAWTSSICPPPVSSGRRRWGTEPIPERASPTSTTRVGSTRCSSSREMDSSDEARRRQRDRIRVVLNVPHDQLQHRIATAVAAGGKVVDTTDGRTRLSDPEGNELDLVSEL